ncbi:hypothetical protein WG907_05170 [Sphingobium sp. AN558]|uniref:hypothetical protein n=1 Tax=Sphingobium sp. AN558 TaxID=3133442 RepID=UPI0030C0178E
MVDLNTTRELTSEDVTATINQALLWASGRYQFPMVSEADNDGVDLTITFGSGQRFRVLIEEMERVEPATPESALAKVEAMAAALDAQPSGEAPS